MPAEKYSASRSDGIHIGKSIRELIRLMIDEGETWQRAADAVGIKRTSAYRALHKPPVIAYRRELRKATDRAAVDPRAEEALSTDGQ